MTTHSPQIIASFAQQGAAKAFVAAMVAAQIPAYAVAEGSEYVVHAPPEFAAAVTEFLEPALVERFDDPQSAQNLASRLAMEGIACRVTGTTGLTFLGADGPGTGRFQVFVPAGLLQRAQEFTTPSQVSEDELADLALHTPPPADDQV